MKKEEGEEKEAELFGSVWQKDGTWDSYKRTQKCDVKKKKKKMGCLGEGGSDRMPLWDF